MLGAAGMVIGQQFGITGGHLQGAVIRSSASVRTISSSISTTRSVPNCFAGYAEPCEPYSCTQLYNTGVTGPSGACITTRPACPDTSGCYRSSASSVAPAYACSGAPNFVCSMVLGGTAGSYTTQAGCLSACVASASSTASYAPTTPAPSPPPPPTTPAPTSPAPSPPTSSGTATIRDGEDCTNRGSSACCSGNCQYSFSAGHFVCEASTNGTNNCAGTSASH